MRKTVQHGCKEKVRKEVRTRGENPQSGQKEGVEDLGIREEGSWPKVKERTGEE